MESDLIFYARESDLDSVAKNILDKMMPPAILLLYGEMGAGKTTFTKAICRALGCEDEASSPSFSIISIYNTSHKLYGIKQVVHMDLFRLRSSAELRELGMEEYLFGDYFCIVEWPDLIKPLLKEQEFVELCIEVQNPELRVFHLKK
ncbi:MAG: tRNA (adenosine(37)-N6)-threonylcarbamoyltransferase complex ATPase subunit type 1 TsaE [Saprospiraceae bacterium]|nr:tRNA (adenosine(37)-N6)-threonylcarbamoyltransferase complex ATPase subunit type 1 TsaE [Saprospiraceae bacterium]